MKRKKKDYRIWGIWSEKALHKTKGGMGRY